MKKLTRENKIEIYERRKNGETISSLAKAFNIDGSKIKYLITFIRRHRYNILRNGKNRVYSKNFKLQIINRVLVNQESINSVAIDIGLASSDILHNWLSKFNIIILIKKILMRGIKMLLKKSKKFTMRIKEDMVITD